MTTVNLEQELLNVFRTLTDAEKREAIFRVKGIKGLPSGTSGADAIRIAHDLNFDDESLREMAAAIEAFEETPDTDDLKDVQFDDTLSP